MSESEVATEKQEKDEKQKPVDVQERMMGDLFQTWLTLEVAKTFFTTCEIARYHHEEAGDSVSEKHQKTADLTERLVRHAQRDFDEVWRAIEHYMRRSAMLIYSKDTSSAFQWLKEKLSH